MTLSFLMSIAEIIESNMPRHEKCQRSEQSTHRQEHSVTCLVGKGSKQRFNGGLVAKCTHRNTADLPSTAALCAVHGKSPAHRRNPALRQRPATTSPFQPRLAPPLLPHSLNPQPRPSSQCNITTDPLLQLALARFHLGCFHEGVPAHGTVRLSGIWRPRRKNSLHQSRDIDVLSSERCTGQP
jgi:hypothetical protein